MSYLIDTNVLGRIVQRTHSMHIDAVNAIRVLRKQQESLCIVPQNLIELWVVATRPVASNGFGLLAKEAAKDLAEVQTTISVAFGSSRAF